MDEFITKSQKETQDLAASFAKRLSGGQVYILKGDLGSGKTTFVQGLAKALGIDNVTSPTFVLSKEYHVRKRKGEIDKIIHADAYRIKRPEEFIELGGFDQLDVNTALFIEWGEKVIEALPKNVKLISFKIIENGDKRRIIFE